MALFSFLTLGDIKKFKKQEDKKGNKSYGMDQEPTPLFKIIFKAVFPQKRSAPSNDGNPENASSPSYPVPLQPTAWLPSLEINFLYDV